MAKKKIGLEGIYGKGFREAISNIEGKNNGVQTIKTDQIIPNPYQPRKLFDESKIKELANSIAEHGVISPIVVKEEFGKYILIAGERRLRASKIAKLEEIPAIITDYKDQEMREIAIIENIQREQLNSIEEAMAYKELADSMGVSQEKIAKKVGKSRAHITNTMGLLKLPLEVQNYVLEGKLTMGHIKPLNGLPKNISIEIAKHAIDNSLTARKVEDLARNSKNKFEKNRSKKGMANNIYDHPEKLVREKFQTKVKITDSEIKISYVGTKDLNRILDILGVIK